MINIFSYKKIILVGVAGSGKSYMAKQLADLTNIPLTHLDSIFWLPNWIHVDKSKFIEMQKEIIAKESWIIDGNYNGTMELRFSAADLVIFLDVNRWTCILSVIFRHGKKRADLPEYLDEKYDKDFFEFIKWIYTFKKKGRVKIFNLHKEFPDKTFVILKTRRAMKEFIKQQGTGVQN